MWGFRSNRMLPCCRKARELASCLDGRRRRATRGYFFSSRRRHTRYWRDWSSDVCSSDLGGNTDDVVVATKGGITRGEGDVWGSNATMSYLREAVEKSLRNLGVDVIDLYQWHRPDRSMVYADAITNFKQLRDEGKIKAVGISNANVEEIQIAIDVLGEDGLVSVQNQFSPRFRCSETELDFCAERGIAFLPWSPDRK